MRSSSFIRATARSLAVGSIAVMLLATAHAENSAKLVDAFKKSYAAEAAGKWSNAFQAMVELLPEHQGNYAVMVRMAYLKSASGEYQEAARLYGAASDLKPEAVEPIIYQQYQFILMKDWSSLATAARAGLARDTQNYTSRSRLAYALYNLGRYAEAGENYMRVTALYPLDLDALVMRGWCYAQLGRKPLAVQLFREVLTLSPENQSAKDGLAYVEAMKER